MASPAPLDAPPGLLALESAAYLDNIMSAPTREAVSAAMARGLEYLKDLVATGEIGPNYGRSLRALQEMAAAERLRDLPAPGAPTPVGLFGGRP
jgi:hypothetical protein